MVCQAKPAQLETWYPAEAWLAPATNNHPIVYHRLEILTQTCPGSHQCHGGDDIWNFVPYSSCDDGEWVNGMVYIMSDNWRLEVIFSPEIRY